MTDDADHLTADELDQLAQSLAVDGSLGRADTLRVVDVLRALARERREPGSGSRVGDGVHRSDFDVHGSS